MTTQNAILQYGYVKYGYNIHRDYSDPYSESFHPFFLFRIVLIKSAPAYAKHCTFLRKALQLPTQSFATANAKLCLTQAFI